MEANPFRNASSLTRRLLRVKRDSPRTTNPRECRCFIIAIHLPRRLAFGAERRGDETKSKREECPAVHQRMILSLGNGNYGVDPDVSRGSSAETQVLTPARRLSR